VPFYQSSIERLKLITKYRLFVVVVDILISLCLHLKAAAESRTFKIITVYRRHFIVQTIDLLSRTVRRYDGVACNGPTSYLYKLSVSFACGMQTRSFLLINRSRQCPCLLQCSFSQRRSLPVSRLFIYFLFFLDFSLSDIEFKIYCFSLFLGIFKRCGTLWVSCCMAFNISSFTTIELTKQKKFV